MLPLQRLGMIVQTRVSRSPTRSPRTFTAAVTRAHIAKVPTTRARTEGARGAGPDGPEPARALGAVIAPAKTITTSAGSPHRAKLIAARVYAAGLRASAIRSAWRFVLPQTNLNPPQRHRRR